MRDYTVGIIGTGPDPDNPVSGKSFAMGYRHAQSYNCIGRCELVACADLVQENAEAFAKEFNISKDHVYESHETMLADAQPDIVSVTVPPNYHADLVADCANSEAVQAIHCEKPMAATWGDALLMTQQCERQGVQLTINHQHRYGEHVRKTKELIDEGRVGQLKRLEYGWGDFFDSGTHAIDMLNYFNDDRPSEWVLAALDYRKENVRYGVHTENQMLAQWKYDNDVHGLAATGPGGKAIDNSTRIVGNDGTIEIRFGTNEGPPVRLKESESSEWIGFDDAAISNEKYLERAIKDVVSAIEEDREPTISARNALNATEIIFAGYESIRRRGRVNCPLDIDDHPLEALVESGNINPD